MTFAKLVAIMTVLVLITYIFTIDIVADIDLIEHEMAIAICEFIKRIYFISYMYNHIRSKWFLYIHFFL